MAILSRLTWDHSFSVGSENPTWIHPLETFHPSMDYNKFESEFIRPYLRTAQICRADHASSQLHLTLAPGRASFVDLLSALEETDYNQSLRCLESSVTPTPSLDEDSRILPLAGFISGIHPDCFLFLSPFLGSMLDFLGEGGLEDSLEKDDLTDISGLSRSTLISPSEVEVAGAEEYLEDEGN
jgi:hypothetical protein